MAKRTNWKLEFRALLAHKRLVGRDRTFIESLHKHYSSGKAMTRGRKHHFFLVKMCVKLSDCPALVCLIKEDLAWNSSKLLAPE